MPDRRGPLERLVTYLPLAIKPLEGEMNMAGLEERARHLISPSTPQLVIGGSFKIELEFFKITPALKSPSLTSPSLSTP